MSFRPRSATGILLMDLLISPPVFSIYCDLPWSCYSSLPSLTASQTERLRWYRQPPSIAQYDCRTEHPHLTGCLPAHSWLSLGRAITQYHQDAKVRPCQECRSQHRPETGSRTAGSLGGLLAITSGMRTPNAQWDRGSMSSNGQMLQKSILSPLPLMTDVRWSTY